MVHVVVNAYYTHTQKLAPVACHTIQVAAAVYGSARSTEVLGALKKKIVTHTFVMSVRPPMCPTRQTDFREKLFLDF
jgi:hypothetical protein